VKLITHLYLAPRSKNAWSYTSTPQYAFMEWFSVKNSTGTTLLLQVYLRVSTKFHTHTKEIWNLQFCTLADM